MQEKGFSVYPSSWTHLICRLKSIRITFEDGTVVNKYIFILQNRKLP